MCLFLSRPHTYTRTNTHTHTHTHTNTEKDRNAHTQENAYRHMDKTYCIEDCIIIRVLTVLRVGCTHIVGHIQNGMYREIVTVVHVFSVVNWIHTCMLTHTYNQTRTFAICIVVHIFSVAIGT